MTVARCRAKPLPYLVPQGFVMLPSDMKLLIRAEASPQIGTGTVTRCLSLAKAWQTIGGQAAFACGNLPRLLQRTIAQQGFPLYTLVNTSGDGSDARETSEVAEEFEPDWIVLDGPQFGDSYQSRLRSSANNLMVIADATCSSNSAADLIVRQLGSSHHESDEGIISAPQILHGFDFFLPQDGSGRPDSTHEQRHIAARARRILITMGSAEPINFSLRILESLHCLKISNLVVDLVVASDCRYLEELHQLKKESNLNLRCHRNSDRVSALAHAVDLVITSADAACLEMARQGCPAILFSMNDRQIALAAELDRLGVAINAGPAAAFDADLLFKLVRSVSRNSDLRGQMSIRGPQVVDGQGASRIARRLAQPLFELRPANITDANELHGWRNEPEYRALSFSPQPISLASHHTWLERKLKSHDSLIWIATDKSGASIGTIAINSTNLETANLAICLCPTYRGRGLGPILIEKASIKLFREYDVDRILVQFKPGNTASQHAFKKAGYRPVAPTTVNGFTALQMVFERTNQKFEGQTVSSFRKSA